ncbi:MAG: hypothetical protein AB1749_12495 [Pseudomonadota bacterium]
MHITRVGCPPAQRLDYVPIDKNLCVAQYSHISNKRCAESSQSTTGALKGARFALGRPAYFEGRWSVSSTQFVASLSSVVAVLVVSAAPALADPSGKYTRKNGDVVQVSVSGGKLYCKIVSGSQVGFEMCHGMSKSGGGWAGNAMKHPDMPGFMTFNGTVTGGGSSISIKGCAIGQSMCDSETWAKAK